MKKITVLVIVLALLVSCCACGGDEQEASMQEITEVLEETTENSTEETPEVVTEKVLLLEDAEPLLKSSTGEPDIAALDELAEKTGNYRYIVIEDTEGGLIDVYAYPEEEFKALYENVEAADYLKDIGFEKEADVFNTIVSNAGIIIDNMLVNEGLIPNALKEGENTYFAFNNTGEDVKAFGNILESGMSVPEYFEKEDLRLVFNNTDITKLIGSVSMAGDIWCVYAGVSSEVTCISNSGIFSDSDWIPEKGSYENINFGLVYMTYVNSGMHCILLNDVSANISN